MKIRKVDAVEWAEAGGPVLTPGKTVRGRVVSRAGQGRFKVSVSGYLLEADSDLPLEDGQKLIARVEVTGDRVLLRLQDDSDGDSPVPAEDDSQEIRRVLEGLGHEPNLLDLMEFQERLARYRSHGSLVGLEPSDIWVLAILWTRGLRGGSDAFALTSFYLRRLALDGMAGLAFPPPADFIEGHDESNEPCRAAADPPGALISGLEDRLRETLDLLNRYSAACGSYQTGAGLHFLKLDDGSSRRSRWADNPIKPEYVLETVRTESGVSALLYLLQGDPRAATRVEAWRESWRESLTAADLVELSFSLREVQDPEELRFIFWQKWRSDSDHVQQA